MWLLRTHPQTHPCTHTHPKTHPCTYTNTHVHTQTHMYTQFSREAGYFGGLEARGNGASV